VVDHTPPAARTAIIVQKCIGVSMMHDKSMTLAWAL
jgi:hypothetical protein